MKPRISKARELSAKVESGIVDLQLIGDAYPEQYEAFLDGERVGYLRLRHGSFTVEFPDCGGETIYEASPRGLGRFEEDERDYYLRCALNAIYQRLVS